MTARPLTRPATNDYYAPLKARRAEIEAAYRALTPKSAALFASAAAVLPGGYSRDAVMRKPYPSYISEGHGSVLRDVDGREIVDFWFNATSLPLGHAHVRVTEAVGAQILKGSAFFAPTEIEQRHAAEVLGRLPGAERIRFTNSGSEGVMMALRLARAFTGRAVVAKFEGSYHGSYDDVSWSVAPPADRLGPLEAPAAVAESAGVPSGLGRALVMPFNDLERTTALIEAHAGEIAAVLVEPMANRMGLVLPEASFITGLRALCDRHGIVLIFDEVIAFRVGYNGAQGLLGITPDMTTLGKIIGGGFPVGAVAGRAEILDLSAPDRAGRVTHAGTFNANPVTMVAGNATMTALDPEAFAALNARGEKLRAALRRICEGLPLQVTGAGSLFKITALDRAITSYRQSVGADKSWEDTASLALLTKGFLMTAAMQGCISTVTTDAQIDDLLTAIKDVVTSW